MRELVLTGVPGDFDPDKHLLLSVANFQGHEDAFQTTPRSAWLRHPLTREEHLELGQLTGGFAASQVPVWSARLNSHYGVEYPDEYWYPVLFPWLATLTQIVFEVQRVLRSAIDQLAGERVRVRVAPEEPSPRPRDVETLQFLFERSRSGYFWLASRLLARFAPSDWLVEAEPTGEAPNVPARPDAPSLLDRAMGVLASRCGRVTGMGALDRILISTLLSLKPPVAARRILIGDSISEGAVLWDAEIDDLFGRLAPSNIWDLDPPTPAQRRGKISLHGGELYMDVNSQLRAGSRVAGGELVAVSQHGGYFYGTGYMNELIRRIECQNRVFVSWGCREVKGGEVVVLPSPALSRLRPTATRNEGEVLFFTTAVLFHNQRYRCGLPPELAFEYRLERAAFLRGLSGAVRNDLFYRPYPSKEGMLEDEAWMKREFEGLRFLTAPKVHDQLCGARLLVMDNPGTTLAIAISAGIPTLVFWEPRFFGPNDLTHPVFEVFEDVGIYHPSAAGAAEFVNQIHGNVNAWWESPRVREARELFCASFAQGSRSWRGAWMRALWHYGRDDGDPES